jgi:hypothetical protein
MVLLSLSDGIHMQGRERASSAQDLSNMMKLLWIRLFIGEECCNKKREWL